MVWAGAGLAIGARIGATFGPIIAGGIGVALGAALGAAIGLVVESACRPEGRRGNVGGSRRAGAEVSGGDADRCRRGHRDATSTSDRDGAPCGSVTGGWHG